MTIDTVLTIAITSTKAITSAAVMQLVEAGRLELDAAAAEYLDELDNLQVLDGFDDGVVLCRGRRHLSNGTGTSDRPSESTSPVTSEEPLPFDS